MEMIARYRRRFAHECEAFAKVVGSLEGVPEGGKGTEGYRRAVSLLAHMAMGRGVWLERLGRGAPAGAVLFPEAMPLEEAVARWEATARAWASYLRDLGDEDLDRVVEYTSFDGKRFRSRVEDILTQLDMHAPYHRGQIAMLVKEAGGEPALTDFIVWSREAVDAGA